MHIMHTEINIEALRPRRSAMRPNSQPPIGRIKNRRQRRLPFAKAEWWYYQKERRYVQNRASRKSRRRNQTIPLSFRKMPHDSPYASPHLRSLSVVFIYTLNNFCHTVLLVARLNRPFILEIQITRDQKVNKVLIICLLIFIPTVPDAGVSVSDSLRPDEFYPTNL